MNKVRKEVLYYGLSVLAVILLLAVWWAAAAANENLASPPDTVDRFFRLMENPIMGKPIYVHILASVRRIMIAFVAASVVGIGLGVCFGIFPTFRRMFWPVFSILRPIPPLAWIPIVILWFGVVQDTSKYIIIFIGIVMAIVINTYAGISETDQLYLKAGQVLGASKWQILVHITLPNSIPAIFAGMKTGLSTGWMSVVAAEMIAAKEGIGFLINMSMKTTPDTALDFVGIVLVALCSSVVSFILTVIERKLCPWLRLDTK